MEFTVKTNEIKNEWRRVEEYHNSTLRYTPAEDFPDFYADTVGKAKIMRCWVTLDEIWDYRTNEFFWNFKIGEKRYPDEELHYLYDWKDIVPSPAGTLFADYLRSFSSNAEEVLLNIRRLERETTDGIISYEQYEDVVEKVVEYCKNLCPNIRYIECCNEVEIRPFGSLTMPEYYKLYKCTYRAVSRLNKKHNYDIPLGVGGFALAGCQRYDLWYGFLCLLASDDSPERMIDFYSTHTYSRDPAIFINAYEQHKRYIKELKLPEVPYFLNEYGANSTTGVLTHSLRNAAGILRGFFHAAEMDNYYIFPWCSFHNPNLQMSFTQFLANGDGSYIPTPNGNAITMLHRLLKYQLVTEGDTKHQVAATKENDKIVMIITNPDDVNAENFTINIDGTAKTIVEYMVNVKYNNCVTGDFIDKLTPTNKYEFKNKFNVKLDPNAFCMIEIY